MVGYDQRSPDYATAYKDAYGSSEFVKDSSKTHSSQKQDTGESTVPVSTNLQATKHVYTGGASLQLPLSLLILMMEMWRGQDKRP